MNEIKKKRVTYIDVARGIAILMVIFGHLSVPFISSWIYSFHIPLFFFLSGMVFRIKKEENFISFIKRKIKSIVIPYFALGIVIWLFFSIIFLLDKKPPAFIASAIDTPGKMFVNFILQRHYWTVWFLACLFFASLIFWAQLKFINKKWLLFLTSLVICGITFIYYRLGGNTLFWNIDTALIAQFFMMLGYLFKNSYKLEKIKTTVCDNKINQRKFIFTLIFLLLNIIFWVLGIKIGNATLDMSVHIYGIEVFTMLSAIFGILFVLSVSSCLSTISALVYLGQNTMLVFAWHSRIVIVAFKYLYFYIGVFQNMNLITSCIYALITAVGIFIILLPIDYLIRKSKLKWMLGK